MKFFYTLIAWGFFFLHISFAQIVDNVQTPIPPVNGSFGDPSSTPADPDFYQWGEIGNIIQGVNIFLPPTEIRPLYVQTNNFLLAFNSLQSSSFILKLDVNYDDNGWETIYDDGPIQSVGWETPPAYFQSLGHHNLKVKYWTVDPTSPFLREYEVFAIPSSQQFHRDNTHHSPDSTGIFTTGNTLTYWNNPIEPNAKPFLVVEGFDPSNSSYAEFYVSRGEYLIDKLFEEGYHVYVLNNNLGSQNIANNAAVAASAITYISDLNGGAEVFVAGISMGGLIARYAITLAENDSTPLPVSAFASFDSPQQGAVIDRYFQDFAHYPFGNSGICKKEIDVPGLNNIAAKQMLLYNTYDPTGMERTAFMATLDSMNNGNGYPTSIPTIGISFSNGMPNPNIDQDWVNLDYNGVLGSGICSTKDTFVVEEEWAQPGSLLPLSITNQDPLHPLGGTFTQSRLSNPTFIPKNSALDIVNGKSRFCFDISTNDSIQYFHDQIPEDVIDALIEFTQDPQLGLLENGKSYNFTENIGQYVRDDVTIEGIMYVNHDGLSGHSDNPEAPSPIPLYTVKTSRCLPVLVSVEDEGTLEIGDMDGPLRGIFIVREGSVVHIKEGGNLNLTYKSKLIIEQGAKLIIDNDANINILHSESSIHVKGELQLNGVFNFSGSGFFEFDETNVLNQYAPFVLQGQAKGKRMVRLNKYATLHIDHHGIFLEDGRVDYEDYGRILQGPGGMARFVHTDFKGLGQDNSIALETDDAEQVFVFQCTFYDLDRGLQLRNMGPGQTASVQYSNFTNNLGAIAAENVDRITLTECDIDAGATGIVGLDLFDVGDMALVNTDVHHFPYTSGAIRLVNTKRFRMFGGEVADNQLGLLAPAGSGDPNESNVFLYQQATFRHNQVGISMPNGGFDRGLVLMDCAVMWENQVVAIEGVDVELQIDACINSGDPTCTNIRPNVFRPYGGSLYFDICYRERDDDGFIPAKGNYWAAIPAAGAPHGNYYIRESFIPDTTQMNPDCGPLLLLDYSFRVPNLPAGCSYAPDPEDPENPENPENPTIPKDQCFVDDGSGQVLLHDQYNQAYEVFRDTLGNPDGFVPIAGISNTIRDTATYTCRRYIDIARAIVDASAPPATEIDIDDAASLAALNWEPGVLRKLESRQYEKARPASSRMLLYPNPVREELTVTAGPGRYELRVYDSLGRLKHSRRMDGQSRLNVKSWLSGVYMVQLTGLSSFEVQQGRFVVR